MTIIYITENNTKRYGVTFQNNGCVKVQKFEDISNDENTIYSAKPMRIFLGKSQVCNMTMFSGALDKKVFDGNNVLLKISEENEKHKYVYIGGDMVCSFMTSDKIYEYISNMGNKLCPYSVATGGENYYFLAPNFKFIKKDKIDYNTILDGIYVPDSDLKESFKELELCKIHSNYDYNIYGNLSHYYLKHQIPMGHSLFFRRKSQNRDYTQNFCNDKRKSFHFVFRQWYSYNNPQC